MPRVIRVSDIIEEYGEKAVMTGLTGLLATGLSALLFAFRGQGSLDGLASVLALGGLAGVFYAVFCIYKARKVGGVKVVCPYCQVSQLIAEAPSDDFACIGCNRMIPVREGEVLTVSQVRCGFCNSLNYYSPKTEILLCENCNHEIPISTESGEPTKKLMPGFAVQDDERLYELILTEVDHRSDELMASLQSILALNRNQVKNLLDDLPTVLLRGIPKKKAEMLRAQLSIHGAHAVFEPIVAQEA
jgi:hypothetical protein